MKEINKIFEALIWTLTLLIGINFIMKPAVPESYARTAKFTTSVSEWGKEPVEYFHYIKVREGQPYKIFIKSLSNEKNKYIIDLDEKKVFRGSNSRDISDKEESTLRNSKKSIVFMNERFSQVKHNFKKVSSGGKYVYAGAAYGIYATMLRGVTGFNVCDVGDITSDSTISVVLDSEGRIKSMAAHVFSGDKQKYYIKVKELNDEK